MPDRPANAADSASPPVDRRTTRPSSRRAGRLAECLAAFTIGTLLMGFFYGGTSLAGGEDLGVPGHDSFYHIKMAALMPQHGLLHRFPWLRFAYFTEHGHDFVSHHYGFHLLLVPFVELSQWLTGGSLSGGRWAICTFFGLTLALFNLLLVHENVRWRWLWLLLFILMPHQFFTRHAFVRAIAPSMVFMLLILLLAFRGRYVLVGLAVAGYTHLYLGGVLYAPVIVGAFAVASMLGPRGDRSFPWRVVLCSAAGWAVGIAVHPYREEMLEFLKLQVFGTGLSPDISVGREWKPYRDVWWFGAKLSGVLLLVWTGAIVARLRRGPRLNARECTLLLLNFAFLLLTLKARRFVESWPVFCLLSAAYLSAPLTEPLGAWLHRGFRHVEPWRVRLLRTFLIAIMVAASVGLAYAAAQSKDVRQLAGDGRLWAVAALILLVPAVKAWITAGARGSSRLARTAGVVTVVIGAIAGTACLDAARLLDIRKTTRCGYDLPAIRKMANFLRDHSQRGDVVFTDDWDIFPVYFYFNSYDRYIVGLDPKFTHARRPNLWARYVKITRGQIPADVDVEHTDRPESDRMETIHVALEDIRDHFGAKFVITDRDHKALAVKLNGTPAFTRLIYPSTSYRESRNAPYLVFQVRDADEPRPPAAP
ncbi:MAG: hypothetical protein ACE5F9_14385 [Phycisphaerae bacterium]